MWSLKVLALVLALGIAVGVADAVQLPIYRGSWAQRDDVQVREASAMVLLVSASRMR
jgi:hypothetical protein